MKKALLIGINYSNEPLKKLLGCINDISKINAKIQQLYNDNPVNIKIITDEDGISASRNNILKYIEWLYSDLQPGDTVYLHYSGHGENDFMKNGYDFRMLTIDGKKIEYITHNELRKYLVDRIPTGCKCFVVFDCCHCGNSFDLRYNYDISGNITTFEQHLESDRLVVFLGACLNNQIAEDRYGNKRLLQRGGTLTNEFINVLNKHGKNVKLKTVFEEIIGGLKKWLYEQTTQIYSSKPINIEEFMIFE